MKNENKLIAEFMGVDQVDIDQAYDDYGELRYHNSWDWLMPVVEKIENLGAKVTIGRMYCEIKYKDLFDKEKQFEKRIVSGVKINAVNGAVIELIKWYNKNKK